MTDNHPRPPRVDDLVRRCTCGEGELPQGVGTFVCPSCSQSWSFGLEVAVTCPKCSVKNIRPDVDGSAGDCDGCGHLLYRHNGTWILKSSFWGLELGVARSEPCDRGSRPNEVPYSRHSPGAQGPTSSEQFEGWMLIAAMLVKKRAGCNVLVYRESMAALEAALDMYLFRKGWFHLHAFDDEEDANDLFIHLSEEYYTELSAFSEDGQAPPNDEVVLCKLPAPEIPKPCPVPRNLSQALRRGVPRLALMLSRRTSEDSSDAIAKRLLLSLEEAALTGLETDFDYDLIDRMMGIDYPVDDRIPSEEAAHQLRAVVLWNAAFARTKGEEWPEALLSYSSGWHTGLWQCAHLILNDIWSSEARNLISWLVSTVSPSVVYSLGLQDPAEDPSADYESHEWE